MKFFGPKSFSKLYDDLTKATFKKYGFINAKIISEWRAIVGFELGQMCKPSHIVFEPNQTYNGTLYVTLINPAFSLILKSHESRIIEKIATFFGYKAVSKMRIILKPTNIANIMQESYEASKTVSIKNSTLPDKLKSVKDDELKAVLTMLYEDLSESS